MTSPADPASQSSSSALSDLDSSQFPEASVRSQRRKSWGLSLSIVLALFVGGVSSHVLPQIRERISLRTFQPDPNVQVPPLVMSGGDPYVRALMRTISASEANDSNPYNLLYGGSRIQDYREHPDECLAILIGPNVGQCTTAAGRYQFLTTTWEEKAKRYHPNPSGWWIWTTYGFEPEYQDQVVYEWLSDRKAWQADIPQLLWEGELSTVLRLLSGTWTSLGYGIEDNDITPYLGRIYDQVLQEELQLAAAQKQQAERDASENGSP